MFLRALTPLLTTNNIDETIAFYTGTLGFKIHERTEGRCTLQKDNVFLVFTPGDPCATAELYFNSTHEFAIKDNNGYTLRFGKGLQPTSDFDKHFPPDLSLESHRVQLRVLRREDIPHLHAIAPSAHTWKYFVKELNTAEAHNAWMEDALQDYGNQRRVPFVIIDKKANAYAGSTSFGNISFYDKRIEIGWTWLGDDFKGTGINMNAKFLLMQYAFETLGFERVELKTDNLNERSKAALKKIGGTPEGILRNHMQMHSNRRRDSIYFSILKDEWPTVKKEKFKHLQAAQ
ncbi:MAG TPA: GNAT family N-acetyltransferase [Chitinophagaceae bacterium]|nr:GNAT family N-acetyltransferase [Chitinophagaceae bacterium]